MCLLDYFFPGNYHYVHDQTTKQPTYPRTGYQGVWKQRRKKTGEKKRDLWKSFSLVIRNIMHKLTRHLTLLVTTRYFIRRLALNKWMWFVCSLTMCLNQLLFLEAWSFDRAERHTRMKCYYGVFNNSEKNGSWVSIWEMKDKTSFIFLLLYYRIEQESDFFKFSVLNVRLQHQGCHSGQKSLQNFRRF